jgi:hypothetical protein
MAENDTTTDDEKTKAAQMLQEKLGDPVVKDEEPIAVEEDVKKRVAHKEWNVRGKYTIKYSNGELEDNIFDRTYIQKPLSYLAFGEFTGLVGRKLAEAMRGPDGLSLDRLTPGEASIPLEFNDGRVSIANEGDVVDPIIQGIARLASYVPDLMAEAQCIWLRVPNHERIRVVDIWSASTDEGGMTLDEGEEMLNIFIEQNYDELNTFLKRYARVKNTVQKMRNRTTKGE